MMDDQGVQDSSMEVDVTSFRQSPSLPPDIPWEPGRRTTRAAVQKKPTTGAAEPALKETIDSEGRLPGSREGLGAFPPGSDLARTMLYLKLRGTSLFHRFHSTKPYTGKRYKTKKERLRVEKEGPPYRPDGSLNYEERTFYITVGRITLMHSHGYS
jgi:bromodomain-containing protein 7